MCRNGVPTLFRVDTRRLVTCSRHFRQDVLLGVMRGVKEGIIVPSMYCLKNECIAVSHASIYLYGRICGDGSNGHTNC